MSAGAHAVDDGGQMKIPPSPGTPQDQGVEVPIYDGLIPPNPSVVGEDNNEFVPNTNVGQFMTFNADDEDTAFSGFTSDFGSTTNHNTTGTASENPPAGKSSRWLPPFLPATAKSDRRQRQQPPDPIAPERARSQNSDAATIATFHTHGTVDPGRIVPRAKAGHGSGEPMSEVQVRENAPFDEDIPFDERTAASRTRSGASLSAVASGISNRKKKKKNAPVSNNSTAADNLSTGSMLAMPNMLDAMNEDDASQYDSDASGCSGSSAQVLEDLNKLSRFMTDRKQSSKGNRSGQPSGSGPSSSRRRRTDNGGGSRKSSFGNNNRNELGFE